jgi:hypothetical protein
VISDFAEDLHLSQLCCGHKNKDQQRDFDDLSSFILVDGVV